jgi:hypothetical protein
MLVLRTASIALAALVIAISQGAAAQWDPEGGDDWQAPPPDQEQQQPPPQQPPPQQQPQQQQWEAQGSADTSSSDSAWSDNEAPPAVRGGNDDDDDASDHLDHAVGHVAVGWLGFQGLPYPGPAGSIDLATVGARIWFSPLLGLDVGLGFHFSTGSTEIDIRGGPADGVTVTDAPQTVAFALHAGLPLAIYHGRHYKFLIIPEIDLGVGTGDDGGLTNLSSFAFSVGGRAGAEIHFGFMGVPELSLQASIGLGLTFASVSVDSCESAACMVNTITTQSQFALRTIELNEPWDIIGGTVAAFYYF